MASGPITSWQIDEETMETVTDFIFLGSKISADGVWSHEIKRCLLLGRKTMRNLDSILKSRDITLPTKVRLVKYMIFPVVMCECESWTIKKAEHQGIGAFELWCWRRLLRFPWTARRSNQSTPKEVKHEYSLEGLMLKLKLQYFGQLMRRADSLEKTLMLRKFKGRRRGWQKTRWLDGIPDSIDMTLSKLWEMIEGQGRLACCSYRVVRSETWLCDWTDLGDRDNRENWHAATHGVGKRTQLSNWKAYYNFCFNAQFILFTRQPKCSLVQYPILSHELY